MATQQPLRILIVTVSAGGIGGMQRHTHDLVRGLITAGHDVDVICPAAEGLGNYLYGARWNLLDTAGRSDPRWSEKVVAAYRAGESRAPYAVVHSESTSALPLLRAHVTTPVAIKFHGNYIGLARAHVQRAITRPRSAHREAAALLRLTRLHLRGGNAWAFRRTESMVVSHQQVRDTVRSHLIPRELIHVVPNGVDTSLFRPRDRPATRTALGLGDGPILATVGRLNLEKGFDVAIEALARVSGDHPEASLLVVGDGEELEALTKLARLRGVGERVHFVGAQPQERVAEYLAASDGFLFPTRRDEAFGLVMAEAMSCGIPVVASKVGAIPEVLGASSGHPAGLLVRPGDIEGLASAVRRLLRDGSLRSSLGADARQRAMAEYRLETMVERSVDVYRAAIARAWPSP